MVSYSQGVSARPLVAGIDGANAILAQINAFSTKVPILSINLGLAGGSFNTGDTLTQSESDTIWNAIFTIYNARLTNYNSQLAAV
jgi:hypothetical protein